MQYIYFGTLLAAVIIFLLCALLLFLQRNKGERSRRILAGMSLLSFANYIGLIVYFFTDPTYTTKSILNVPFLLLGIFVMRIYLVYPVEVISPGWITGKRLFRMYLPVLGLIVFYNLTLWLGMEYTAYESLAQIVHDIRSFEVIFRIVLLLLIFLPVISLYHIPYTRRYNNTDRKWMRGYVTGAVINMLAYLTVNIYDTFLSCSLYIGISIACSLYFTYQELFVRLIRKPMTLSQSNEIQPPHNASDPQTTTPQANDETKASDLFELLEQYMNNTQGWQDPDLSIEKIVADLCINRTVLLKAIKQHGYMGYPAYINAKRIAKFIQIIEQQGNSNYLQTFFDVGFRSKATALRNFREATGMTSSEYFENWKTVTKV